MDLAKHFFDFFEIVLDVADFGFGLGVDGEIFGGFGAIPVGGAVLTHEDDGRLIGGHEGEKKVEKDKGIGIPTIDNEQNVGGNPRAEEAGENDNKCPASRPFRERVGGLLTEGAFFAREANKRVDFGHKEGIKIISLV